MSSATVGAPRRTSHRFSVDSLVKWVAALLIAYLVLSPLYFLLQSTFSVEGDGEAFTISNVIEVFTGRRAPRLARDTAIFAFASTVLAMVLGTGLAYVQERLDIKGKRLVLALALTTVAAPAVLYANAWMTLARPNTGIFSALGLSFVNIYSMAGMVWIEGTTLTPVVFLMMTAAFRGMDPSLEESAVAHGAGRFVTFWRVLLPLVRPALLGAFLLTLIRALESFEIPALVGQRAGIYVYTSQMYDEFNRFRGNMGLVSGYAFVLLVIAVILITLYTINMRKHSGRASETIGGKAFRAQPRPIQGWGRFLAYLAQWGYITFVVILPIIGMVYNSLLPIAEAPSADAFHNMTMLGYREVLANTFVRRGIVNSLILAVAAATIVMVLASIVAWIVVKGKGRGRWALDQLAFLPIVFPGVVLGIAILFVYLRLHIGVYGTLGILLIAYMTKFLPFGMRYAVSGMHQIGSELEEATKVSGASWLQSFRRVVLPLLLPAFFSGWIYVALVSMRDLSTSIILYAANTPVLGVAMWNLMTSFQAPYQLGALGVMYMIPLALVVWALQKLMARFGVEQQV
jgi:iron(III) transport system permease protein